MTRFPAPPVPRNADDVVEALRSLERAYLLGVDGVTEVWLVRHADVYDTLDDVDDPRLSARGREQARRLAERLAQVRVSAVYTSPARRARETAAGLAAEVRVDARLEEARASFAGGKLSIDEPPASVISRMRDAVDAAASAHPGGRIVIVSHGIAILNYLADVLGLQPADLRLYPAYTGVSIVRMKDGQRVAGTLFDVSHLEALR